MSLMTVILSDQAVGRVQTKHAQNYEHNEDGRMAPGVCGNGSVPLSHSENVVTRIGIHTHTHTHTHTSIVWMG